MNNVSLTKPNFEWLKRYNNPNHISTVVGNITVIYKDNGTSIFLYNHKENVFFDLDTLIKEGIENTTYSFYIAKEFIEVFFEGDIPIISINKEKLPFGC